MDFVREQWEEQKKRDAAALIEEKARYTANEERLAPYRGASDALLRQQAGRLGISVPERQATAPKRNAAAARKVTGYDKHGRSIYDTQGVSAQPVEYMEAKADPNAYSVPDAQTLGERAKLKSLMAESPDQSQNPMTLQYLMALSKNRGTPSAFGSGGAFGGMR